MKDRLIRGLPFVAVLLLAVFWIVVWQGMDRSVLSRVPILDEAHYLQRAVEIWDQGWLPDEPFTMSPLYSYLVAATGSGRQLDRNRVREGGPPHGIRVLQAVLWLGIAIMLLKVGQDLLGPRWAWGPPLLWLGYAPAAILAGQVLMEIPLTFVSVAALTLATGQAGSASSRKRALLVGMLVGAAFLLRGTAIVLLVPVVWSLGTGRNWRRRGWWTGAFAPALAGFLLMALPFVVLNSTRADRPIPPALNGGVNLYLGNGPGANGFFHGVPGMDVENDASGAAYLSERLGRQVADAAGADRIWSSLARTAIVEDPIRALGLWVTKIRLHLVGIEIPQVSSFQAWQRQAPVLRILVVPWALLAALGLAGGVLAWRGRPGLRPWLVAALLLIAVQSLFFVVTRYRIILVPTLSLMAVGLVQELMRRRDRERISALLCLLLAAGVVWPWGLGAIRQDLRAGGLDNEAVRWEHLATAVAATDSTAAADHLTEAAALWQRSLTEAGDRPESWRGRARVSWARGEHAEATATLTRGLTVVTNISGLRRDLIGMLMRQGRLAEAEHQLALALRDEPADAELLHNRVLVQVRLEQLAAAANTAARLVELHPEDVRGYLDLGAVLGRAGRLEEAVAAYERGLRRLPGNRQLQQRHDQLTGMMSGEKD